MWKGCFSEETDARVQRFTQSLDLDWRMVGADIKVSIAHVRMLGRVGLLTPGECRTLEEALRSIAEEAERGDFVPRESLEDVHMNVEQRLTERCGELGAKLHAGRSRNDQVATTVRLYLKSQLCRLGDRLELLLTAVLDKAEAEATTVVPGYTHLQQAQPITFGHFLLSYGQCFLRDFRRLLQALEGLDECPLGSGALAGSTLPLDRSYAAGELGFSGITENSLDAVAQRDYQFDVHHFANLFSVHVSRLAEDLIIYMTREFGWLDLPDALCTGSSMMPQKKNPDVLELLRGRSAQGLANYADLAMLVKGLPMTYNRDLQEDKRSLWRTLDNCAEMADILPGVVASISIDRERAVAGFAGGFTLATDVAEYLVDRGVPFRRAHELVGNAVRWCRENEKGVDSLTFAEWRKLIPQVEEDLMEILSIESAVARRSLPGGTAPGEVRRSAGVARQRLERYAAECREYGDQVGNALD
ncbi:MAG: argininosuccinate lyase [Synergistales bacterium]|nr:argininosuccinate lyase [Synergistales bacterium]